MLAGADVHDFSADVHGAKGFRKLRTKEFGVSGPSLDDIIIFHPKLRELIDAMRISSITPKSSCESSREGLSGPYQHWPEPSLVATNAWDFAAQ